MSIIVIDHNYAHLFELCDRINVMQGGRITTDQSVKETSLEQLTELMISSYRQELDEVPRATPDADEALGELWPVGGPGDEPFSLAESPLLGALLGRRCARPGFSQCKLAASSHET